MIEKLTVYPKPLPNNPMVVENIGMDNKSLFDKINELVDAVNELQTEVNKMAQNLNFAQPEVKENVQDKFAEQRRWIGKLCRFWDTNIGENVWGILGGIDFSENEKYPYWCDQLQEQYQNCEPVKPDDDIIYKGE